MKHILRILISILVSYSFGHAQVLRDASGYTILAPGEKAPEWVAVASDGSQLAMPKISTEFLLLGFVEPGCEMCRALLPGLSELQERFQKTLTVVLMSDDSESSEWEAWVHDFGSVLRMALATKSVLESYKVEATPTLYLLDQDRKVASTRLVRAEDVDSLLMEKKR